MLLHLSLRLLLLTCCLLSTPAWAQDSGAGGSTTAAGGDIATQAAAQSATPPATPPTTPALQHQPFASDGAVSGAGAFTVILALAAVVLLIYGCAWLMKRLGAANIGGVAGMKIVAGVSVGPREKVLLLEVGEQQVLIGVAPGRVSHLQSFEQPVVEKKADSGNVFSQKLKTLMNASDRQDGGAP